MGTLISVRKGSLAGNSGPSVGRLKLLHASLVAFYVDRLNFQGGGIKINEVCSIIKILVFVYLHLIEGFWGWGLCSGDAQNFD